LLTVAIGSIAGVGFAGAGPHPAGELSSSQSEGEQVVLADDESSVKLEAAVDSVVNPLVERGVVSGSILVARSGEILLAKGFGCG
jgi:hypothetical protein